ncbi:MAG TPA: protein kinase [Gemmatimonadales bacterium]|nr:protein kinase [Gemmatimonadales bacterium]
MNSPSSTQQDRLGAALAGRYTIERELGRGGMSTVYLADDLKHHRKVAIKVLRPELGALLGHERFTREIRMAASLSHPHILALYDSGAAGQLGSGEELLWFSMPYVRGESLRHKLSREKQLPVDEAIRITRQIASALDYAHGHGLIHRDIKPENVLLYEGEAMVTDFGIALAGNYSGEAGTRGRGEAERLTGTGMTLGTPEYMSPEQAAGERTLDARSDIYSLGCVLYELLAGEPPHSGGSAIAVLARRFTETPPRVRRQRPEVTAVVEQAITRALAVDPADRFPSAIAFADALTATNNGEPRPPSVAVLPFANFSADPENEFFADGITEDVIAHLSKIRSLKVISRTSVMPFKKREQSLKEIGAKLDASTLLEGSVRRAGSRVRIVAQLIDAESDRHLWAETYDRELTDIFAIQTDVALQIADALQAKLSPEEKRRIKKQPTDDVQAYQLYLMGRHCMVRWTQEGLDQALDYFDQAVKRDPEYALAYATMAYAYADMATGVAGSLPPAEAYKKAKAAVARALELDPGLAEAHAVSGYLKYISDYDWVAAEQQLKTSIELNPNSGEAYDFYGLLLAALERYEEAVAMQRRAYEVDPLAHRMDIATTFIRAGRYDEAEAACKRVLAVDPHFALAHVTLGWAYLLKGMDDQGIGELERAVSLSPESTIYLGQLGQAYARVGRTDDARKVLGRLEEMSTRRYVSPYHFAYIYEGLGEQDTAMDFLERAFEERAGGIFGIKGSFLFRSLRGHPRFQAMLRKMNLT